MRRLPSLHWSCRSILLVCSVALACDTEGDDGPAELAPVTRVTWPRCAQYISTVDRSVSPIYHIDSSFLGKDDFPVAGKEPPDSRTHQLFAMCRQRLRSEALPIWISAHDYQTSVDYFEEEDIVPVAGPADILDLAAGWQNCSFRINADDDRRAITLHQSQLGFDWDTRNVPEGSYLIEGYTLEPPHNAWSHQPRPGVVRVVDRRDPGSNPPAVVVLNRSETLYRNQAFEVEICAAAMPGTTINVDWAVAPKIAEDPSEARSVAGVELPSWQPVRHGIEYDPRAAAVVPFTPPALLIPEGGAEKFLVRVTAVDPLGRQFEAFNREEIDFVGIDQQPLTCPAGG